MPDKDPAAAAAEAAAKELVKVAYGDLLQPAAREVGAEMQEFVRVIMAAGRGFGELIRDTYEPFVLRALAKVPQNRRIAPSPQMLGQVLEGISYEPKGSLLHEMFENLLARSMDSERVYEAHPVFTAIIKQIVPDEARLLRYVVQRKLVSVDRPGNEFGVIDGRTIALYENFNISEPIVERTEYFDFYVSHLTDLNLLSSSFNDWIVDGTVSQVGHIIIQPMQLGRRLIDACYPAS